MKKSFLIFSLVVMFVVILFANTSFAATDKEIIDEIINNAEVTIEKGTINGNNGMGQPFSAPKMVITNEVIENAKTKYNTEISIKNGKIYIGENSYPITIESPSGKELISDQEDGFNVYNMHNTLGAGNGLSMNNEPNQNATFKEGNDVEITFYGYAANDCLDGGYKNYYGEPTGADIKIKVTDNSGNTVSNRENKTESTLNNPIIDVKVENETSGSLQLTEENTYVDENGNRRVMIHISEDGKGAYIFQIIGKDGQPIEIQNGMIFDADGNLVSVQFSEGDLFSGVLNPGYYYIELPEDATTVKTKRITDSTDYSQTQLAGMTTTDNFLNESEKKNWIADFFEKVFFWFVIAMGMILSGLISIIAGENLTIDKLVFDQYGSTSLSFFKNDSGILPNNPLLEGAVDPLNYIFNAFVGVAVVSYMIILVYMGIRILLMSTADGKAKYKEVLLDWIKGIAIIYLFPFVIRFAILLNHAFVDYIYDNLGNSLSEYSASIPSSSGGLGNASDVPMDSNGSSYMVQMYNLAIDTNRLTYALCWIIMLIQVIQFLIVYYKRLITVMFLIAIFPLVSISYAIDKIGDGKSQAFNHWCKEFILQVFIQSFHAMNYVIVMGLVFKILGQDGNINWFLAIVGITYVAKGGDILRGLFAQMGGGGAGGPMQVASALLKTKFTIDAIKGAKNTVKGMVGSQSPIGRGLNKIGQAYDGYLQGSTVERQGQARKAIEQMNVGKQKLSESVLLNDTRNILSSGENASPMQISSVVNTFSNMSEADRDKVLQQLSEADREVIEGVLTHAAAGQIIKNRKDASNVDVRTSVEILINDRTKGGKTLVNKYDDMSGISKMHESGELRRIGEQAKVSAASFEVNREEIASRPAPPKMPKGTEEKLNFALQRIRSAVEKGDSTIDELHDYKDIVDRARSSGNQRLIDMIGKAEDDMGFTIDDFSTNLAIQTVNHSIDEYVVNDKKKMDRYNAAVREIRSAMKDDKNLQVINDLLMVDADKLHEGYLPNLEDKREEPEKVVAGNIYTSDDEEYTEYLIQKGREMKRDAKRDAALGAIRTAGGAIVGGAKLGLGVTAGSVALGASIDTSKKDNNILEQAVASGTTGFNIGSGAVDKIGEVASTVKGAGSNVVDTVHSIVGRPAQPKYTVDNAINRKSIEINENYYNEKAAREQAEKKVENASRILNELKKRRK